MALMMAMMATMIDALMIISKRTWFIKVLNESSCQVLIIIIKKHWTETNNKAYINSKQAIVLTVTLKWFFF